MRFTIDNFLDKFGINNLIKKLGATRIIVLSFAFVISIGTLLLSFPISQSGESVKFIDNLFTATTATCVTGLATVTFKDVYSFFGQIVILCLIQIGGLGLMSIIAAIVNLSHHKFNFREKAMLQDVVNKIDRINLLSFLKTIFKYTFIFESIGAIVLAFVFVPKFGLGMGIYNAIFLSISAFCNAGIDVLGANSLIDYVNNPVVNFTIMVLIITGGLGFAVWMDIIQTIRRFVKEKKPFKRFFENLKFHSKIVIVMTSFLIISGTILIFVFEIFNPGTIGNLSFGNSIMAALFNSVTLRTAGFSTVNYGNMNHITLFVMCAYMFIGGSPGGTAGGIKTTTFFTLLYYITNKTKDEDSVIYGREIKNDYVLKSLSIFFISLLSVFIFISLLLLFEPNMDPISIIFEAFSAFGTVGLSTGITPLLKGISKLTIIVLMFIGRVGAMAAVLSFVNDSKKNKKGLVEYPRADYLVG